MKLTFALLFAATALATLEPRQQATPEEILAQLGPCKDACVVLKEVGKTATGCGQQPTDDCFRALCRVSGVPPWLLLFLFPSRGSRRRRRSERTALHFRLPQSA